MSLTLPANPEPECPLPTAVLKIIQDSVARFREAFPIIAMNPQWTFEFESEMRRVAEQSYQAGRDWAKRISF